jgi:drug/metabolite transporter (DMT)-like permease
MSESSQSQSTLLPRKIRPGTAYGALTVMVFFLAVSLVVAQKAQEEMPPIGLSFWRWAAGALLLLPFVWREMREKWGLILSRLRFLFFMGAMIGGGGTLLLWALKFTTTMNATLFNSSQPAFTALGAMLFLRHKFSAWQFAGIASAFLGISIIAVRGDWQFLTAMNFNPGDILVVISTIAFTAYALNIHSLPGDLSMALTAFLIIACGTILILPFYIAETILVKPVPVTLAAIGSLAYLALFTSVLTIYIWNLCNNSIGPHRAAVFLNLFPFYSAGLAVAYLGESLYAYHYWGVALVCTGITLVLLMEQRQTAATGAPNEG